jgi:hypothetical protein
VVSRKNTIHREKDEIVLFTTRCYYVSQMCRNTATFVKTLFTNPVNSKTTVYRERESRTDLMCPSLSPHPSIYRKCGVAKLPKYSHEKYGGSKVKRPK